MSQPNRSNDPNRQVSLDEWEDVVFKHYGVPDNLRKAMASQESGGDVDAVSPTGVRGRYQVTENTAKMYGLDRNDPYQQAVAAAKHLRSRYDSFKKLPEGDGRWLGAVGRYYGGDGAVDDDGNLSRKSPDGVSTPDIHVERVAKLWGDLNKGVTSSATPPAIVTPQTGPIDKPVNRPVQNQPIDGNQERYKKAADLVRGIEGAKREAVNLFRQADQSVNQATSPDSAGAPVSQSAALRAQAEGKLEYANRLTEAAQKDFGDLVEAGFGEDSDKTSSRRWGYAKPKKAFVEYFRNPSAAQRAAATRPADIAATIRQQQRIKSERERFNQRSLLGQQAERAFTGFAGRDPEASPEAQEDLAIRRAALGMGEPETPAGGQEFSNRLDRGFLNILASGARGATEIGDLIPALTAGMPRSERRLGQAAAPYLDAISRGAVAASPVDPNNESWLTAKIPEGIGSVAGFALGGGGRVGAALLGAATNAGQIAEEFDKAGGDPRNRDLGVAVAALTGTLEAFGLEGVLNKLGGGRGLAKRLIGAGQDAGQEYVTEVVNDVNARLVGAYDPNRPLDPLSKNKIEAGLLGLLLGGGGEIAGATVERLQGRAEAPAGGDESVFAPPAVSPEEIEATRARYTNQQRANPLQESIRARNQMAAEGLNEQLGAEVAGAGAQYQQLQQDQALREQARIDQAEALNSRLAGEVETDRRRGFDALNKQLAGEVAAEGRTQQAAAPPVQPETPRVQVARAERATSRTAQLDEARSQSYETAVQLAGESGVRAESFASEGRIQEAIAELQSQQVALQSAIKSLPNTPESLAAKTSLARQASLSGQRLNDLRRSARAQAVPAQRPAVEEARANPLLESVVNPEGGTPESREFERRPGDDFARLAAQQKTAREDAPNLLTAIRRAGGISDDGDTSGELRRLGLKEGGTTGIVNSRSRHKIDAMREMMRDEGLTQAETIAEFYDEIEEALRTSRRAGNQQTEDEHYENLADRQSNISRDSLEDNSDQAVEPADNPSVREAGALDSPRSVEPRPLIPSELTEGIDPEDLAALEGALRRSRAANPREYGDRTRPGEPGSSGVSFSPYNVLVSNNRADVNRLSGMNLNSPEARQITAKLRDYSIRNNIELRHLHNLLNYVRNDQLQAAQEEDRDALMAEMIAAGAFDEQEAISDLEQRVDRTEQEVRQDLRSLPRTEADRFEMAVEAIADLYRITREDPDMMDLYERGVRGTGEDYETFIDAAGAGYGFDEQTARDAIDGARRDYQSRAQNQSAASQTGDAQRSAQPDRAEESGTRESDERESAPVESRIANLLDADMAAISDADYDTYFSNLEDLRNQFFRGLIELPELAQRQLTAKLKAANIERHDRVDNKRLLAKSKVPHAPSTSRQAEERTNDERVVRHSNPELDGQPILGDREDGRVVVANPNNKTGISVVKDQAEYRYASTQVNLPPAIAEKIIEFGRKIPDSDLAEDGREDQPHITVLYGLHGENPARMRELLADVGPVTVKFGKTSLFENDEQDVLKVEIESDQLKRLHELIKDSLPNTQTFPEYKPHATIAYLKPGKGKKYAGSDFLAGQSAEIEEVAFSNKDGDQVEIPLTEDAEPVAESDSERVAPANPMTAAFLDAFRSGRKFGTIVQARALAKETLGKLEPAQFKEVDEAIEAAAVLRAREIVAEGRAEGWSGEEVFDRLTALIDQQPNLTARTSTSVANQAYSTPIPLALVASRRAGIDNDTTVYEPAAGNGALVIEADPANVTANELNPDRVQNLQESLPGAEIHEGDATSFTPKGKFDVVIANPPFGPVRESGGGNKRFTTPFGETTEIDHAIAFKALESMKDDGRASLIVGGPSKQVVTEEARADAYNSAAKRRFYYYLYNNYNVTDHFSIAGEMYAKQGAGWPVDVIVIEGRGKSRLELPAVKPPRVIRSYDELRNQITDEPNAREERSEARGVLESGPSAETRSDRGAPRADDRQSAGLPAGARNENRSDDRTGAGRESRTDDRGREGASAPGVRLPDVPRRAAELAERQSSTPRTDTQSRIESAARPEPEADRQSSLSERAIPADQPARLGERTNERSRRASELGPEKSHATYEPLSKAKSLQVAVPQNMSGSVQQALSAFEQRHGSPDTYVADKLGYSPDDIPKYFSAEQVDALALAVSNIEDGKGFVIGDQTGIGKGRINAGVIRYAIKNKKTPVFVTQKPALYADMIRDLGDIGMPDVRVLITNSGEAIPLNDAGTEWMQAVQDARANGQKAPPQPSAAKVFRATPQHDKLLEKIASSGALGGQHDVVFTTYDQMNPSGGQFDRARHKAVSRLVEGGVLVLDESHTAGGTAPSARGNPVPTRSKFFRGLVNRAGSVFYSSATYAKRPDVMDLYSKTDLGLLGSTPSALAELFQRGGVALQQVVAAKLAQAGQYLRRERTFDGIRYEPEVVTVKRDQAEAVSKAMSMISDFDEMKKAAVKALDKEMRRDAAKVSGDGSTGGAGADSTNFTSLMHNVIDQMLLGLKAEQAARLAIEAIRRGERPVLTVSNTMESFLADAGLSPGDAVNISFKDILKRYLTRSRDVTITDRDGKRVRRPLEDDELGPARRVFENAEAFIESADFGDLPISPIDYVRQKITDAGYQADEITGRQTRVDYSDKEPILRVRPQADTKVAGRRRVIQQFNDGKIDAIILNQAGSTGISLHASEKVANRDQRHMIIWQAEKNIDTHMQMLGRVNRTGQVNLPRYTQMIADVPAEKRPAAVLLKKMASLNANTTASRKSAVQTEGVTDFMNELGDAVIARLMAQEPEIHGKLRYPLSADGDEYDDAEAARRVTGRIPLLPLAEQEALYERIEQEYNDFLAQKDAMGENPLEAKTMDYRAETLSREVLAEGSPGSPFSEPAYLEKVKIQVPVKPYTSAEILGKLSDSLGTKIEDLDEAQEASGPKIKQVREDLRARIEDYKDNLAADFTSEATITGQRQKADQLLMKWGAIAGQVAPGTPVTIQTPSGGVSGVVLDLEQSGKPKNPAALGSWKVRLANLDGRELKLSFNDLVGKEGDLRVQRADEIPRYNSETGMFEYQPMLGEFDAAQGAKKQTRYMVTGNIVTGYSKLPKGQILNYTDSEGEVLQGVLLPANFDAEKALKDIAVEFATVDQVWKFLDGAGKVTDGDPGTSLEISRHRDGLRTVFGVNGSKAGGGKYFLSPALRDLGMEFTGNRTRMTAIVGQDTARKAIAAIQSGEATGEPVKLQAKGNKEEAKKITSGHYMGAGFGSLQELYERYEASRKAKAPKTPKAIKSKERTDRAQAPEPSSYTKLRAISPEIMKAGARIPTKRDSAKFANPLAGKIARSVQATVKAETTPKKPASKLNLGIPSDRLRELADEYRDNPDDRERISDELLAEYQREQALGKPHKALNTVIAGLGLPRQIMASLDASAPLRQGAILTLPPQQWPAAWRAWWRMWRSFKTSEYDRIASEINSHPDADIAKASGLYLATDEAHNADELTKREEDWVSPWASKIPGVKHSEQAYKTYLDSIRMDTFARYKRLADKMNYSPEETRRYLKASAEWINVATGRGSLGETFDKAAPLLSAVFFAPRYTASRIQLLNPYTYLKNAGTPEGRLVMAQQLGDLAQFAGVVGVTLGLAAMAGATVGLDPDDPDFLKLRFGNTRYDGLAGLQQVMRLFYRVGKDVGLAAQGKKSEGQSAFDIVSRFGRSKLAPVPSYFTDLVLRKDFIGRDFDAVRGAWERIAPLMWADFAGAVARDGWAAGAKQLPGAFGVGVQDYDKKPGVIRNDRSASVARELRKHGLKYDEVDPIDKFEPQAAHQARSQKIEDWLTRYGEKLVDHPRYQKLTPEQQKAALRSLRGRIGGEANEKRPNINRFEPGAIIEGVLKAAQEKPLHDRSKLYVPRA